MYYRSREDFTMYEICQKADCGSCRLYQPDNGPVGGMIPLGDHWTINHYQSKEAFLGWLALQPKCHREHLMCCTQQELEELGMHFKNVETALRSALQQMRPGEEGDVERVYFVLFSESAGWHMHFHVIPRTKRLRESSGDVEYNAWAIIDWAHAVKGTWKDEEKKKDIEKLMNLLRQSLPHTTMGEPE